MKEKVGLLRIPELVLPAQKLSFECIDNIMTLAHVEEHPIACNNWGVGETRVDATFSIAHNRDNIIVRYSLEEESIRAYYTQDDESRPFEDSCVEFFVPPDVERKIYHNIESNCIGALQFKSGTADLPTRLRHQGEVTKQIKRYTTLPQSAIQTQEGDFKWSLIMVIPAHLVGYDKGMSLSGQRGYANFYKCGDSLPHPHYLSWQPIEFERPNFHLPQFFGDIIFE